MGFFSSLFRGIKQMVVKILNLMGLLSPTIIAMEDERRGKKLAIVGPQASGKTVVWTFLLTDRLITEYRPTPGWDQTDGGEVVLTSELETLAERSPIRHLVQGTMDVAGDFTLYETAWRGVLHNAFLVIFLFDVQKFLGLRSGFDGDTYRQLVLDGCEFTGLNINHDDTAVVFGGTHCDLIREWRIDYDAEINQELGRFPEYTRAKAKLGANLKDGNSVQTAVGSLREPDAARELLYSIFDRASKAQS